MHLLHRFGYILASVRTMLLEGPWLIFGVDKSLIFIANNGLCYRLLYTSYCSSSQEMSLKETESETKTSKKDW